MKIAKKPPLPLKDFGKVPAGYRPASTSVQGVAVKDCWDLTSESNQKQGRITSPLYSIDKGSVKVVGNRRWGRSVIVGRAVLQSPDAPEDPSIDIRDSLHLPYSKISRFGSARARHAKKAGEVMLVVLKDKNKHLIYPQPVRTPVEQFSDAVFTRLQQLNPTLVADAIAQFEDATQSGEVAAFLDRLLLSAAEAVPAPKTAIADDLASAPVLFNEIAADPLQAARDRGKHRAVAEWEKPENLPLKAAADYAGRSDRVINEDRQKGRLYALVLPGKERGYRYPQWQFDVEPERLAAVLAPFVQADASCWVIHNFLLRPHESLGDVSPRERLLDASYPIDRIVEVVARRYLGDQGAS